MPEEINRLLTDHLSTILFCPTPQAIRNLSKEGIKDRGRKVVKRVGDVMYDSVLHYSKLAEKKSTILKDLNLFSPDDFYAPNSELKTQSSKLLTPNSELRHAPRRVHGSPEPHMVQGELKAPNYYLVTLHRAENTDDRKRLRSILSALDEIGKDTFVILPLHPRTKKMMKIYHLFSLSRRIKLIEPVSYLNMLKLEKNAKAILTDSGGVQKEAYWFRVPCFTLRDETEWVETVKKGWNILVGTEKERILSEVRKLSFRRDRSLIAEDGEEGRASEKIVKILTGLQKGR
jgi:UDP-N-acetylglucosamine 2-epimerase